MERKEYLKLIAELEPKVQKYQTDLRALEKENSELLLKIEDLNADVDALRNVILDEGGESGRQMLERNDEIKARLQKLGFTKREVSIRRRNTEFLNLAKN